jgi:hypothetical protein
LTDSAFKGGGAFPATYFIISRAGEVATIAVAAIPAMRWEPESGGEQMGDSYVANRTNSVRRDFYEVM